MSRQSRQIHFVVLYDSESNEFEMDYETQDARFDDGYIYNTHTNEWSKVSEDELGDDNSEYCRAADTLYDAIRDLKLRRVSNA